MTIDEIHDMWGQDAQISVGNLTMEAGNIPLLHHKYLKIYSHENLLLEKLNVDYAQLKKDKYEFFTQGPSKETKKFDWELPAKGKLDKRKNETEYYMTTDKDLVELGLKVIYQKEKIEVLKSILTQIGQRSFQINSMVKYQIFLNGGAA
jgi:hypothetical protein